MRILVIKGASQYGGTRRFADDAAEAFRRRGNQVELLDILAGANSRDAVMAAASGGPYDLVFSINILGEFRDPDGRTMAQMFACPHVVWHTDYVLTAWPRLQATPPSTALLVVDPTQVEALTAIGGEGRFQASFFPHPAVGQPAPDDLDVDAFVAARPIPVLWSGSYVEPSRPWASASAKTQEVMDYAMDIAMAVEWIAPHRLIGQVFSAIGLDVTDPAKRHNLVAASVIDAEVRVRRRHAFLQALAQSGVELHICGEGWEPQIGRFPGATWHGPVEIARVIELMRQSRVVLNTNGNFGAGSHERPFTAALAGAATFSDFSRYYAEAFRPRESIELFSWLDLPGAMARLTALAADPGLCWNMAASAKALTLQAHTWDRQAPQILEAALGRV